jgi:hypothetical protein
LAVATTLAVAGCGGGSSGAGTSFTCADIDKPGVLDAASQTALKDNVFSAQTAAANAVTDNNKITAEFQRQIRNLCRNNPDGYRPFGKALDNTREYAKTGISSLASATPQQDTGSQLAQGGNDGTGEGSSSSAKGGGTGQGSSSSSQGTPGEQGGSSSSQGTPGERGSSGSSQGTPGAQGGSSSSQGTPGEQGGSDSSQGNSTGQSGGQSGHCAC